MKRQLSRLFYLCVLIITSINSTALAAENVARKPGVSYIAVAETFFNDHTNDPDNNKLIDGITDSGGQTNICYDFYGKTPEQSFIIVNMDLGTSYQLSKIKLFGKNLTTSYKVDRVKFEISSDGSIYEDIATLQVTNGTSTGVWSVERPVGLQSTFRYVRITAWTPGGGRLNLTELEVWEFPAPQNLVAERIDTNQVFLSWDELGDGYNYRVYRAKQPDFALIDENIVADDLTETSYLDEQVDHEQYYYTITATLTENDEKSEGPPASIVDVSAVASVRGTVLFENAFVEDCLVYLAGTSKKGLTDSNGMYNLNLLPIDLPIILVVWKDNFKPLKKEFVLQAGETEWNIQLEEDSVPRVHNIALDESTTYIIKFGDFYTNSTNDPTGRVLVDGNKNSGGAYAVCCDFWRKPHEDSFISVTLDLEKVAPIQKVVLHGKNQSPMFRVARAKFEISLDGERYMVIGDYLDSQGDIPQTTSLWAVASPACYEEARFIRVTGWTRGESGQYLNLEEVEIFAVEEPPVPQGISVGRLSRSSAKISWEALEEGYYYRVYRSTSQNFIPSVDNWVAGNLAEATFTDTEIDGQEYYYRVSAFVIAGENEIEGIASEAESVSAVAIVKGVVKNEAGLLLADCKVSVKSMGLVTWTGSDGEYIFDSLPSGIPLEIIIERTGYFRATKSFNLSQGQEEVWNVTLSLDQTTGLKNLAMEPGVSYSVSVGDYFAERGPDRGNLMIDGIKNSGTTIALCYDFWNRPPEESYISVDLDLGAFYPVKEIILFGKNLNPSSYHVGRVRFFISVDGITYDQIGEVSGDDIEQPSLWNSNCDVGWLQARFIRVIAWTRLIKGTYLNLEEIEVIGLTRAAKVEGFNVQRLAEEQAKLNWTNQGTGIVYRVYRSKEPNVKPIADNLVADNLQTTFFVDDTIDYNRYYYTVTACVAVGQDRFEGEPAEEQEIISVASIQGYIDGDHEIDPELLTSATIEVEQTGLVATTSAEGYFMLSMVPAERELTIVARLKGYQKESLNITLTPGEVKVWNPTLILDIYAPNPPVNVNAQSLSPGLIELTWETPQPHPEDHNLPSYYNIYRATEAGFEINENNLLVPYFKGTQYYDRDIEGENLYYYAIIAYDEADNDSSPVRVEAQAIPIPQITPIQPLGGIPVVGTIHFKWSQAEGALSYILEYAQNRAFTDSQIVDGIRNCEYTASNLAKGIWYWRVRAVLPFEVITAYSLVQSFNMDVIEDDCLNVREITIYPNPASPLQGEISIGYIIDQPATVMLKIFNTSGKLVRSVNLGQVSAGVVQYHWDGLDTTGRLVNNGVYLVLISATNFQVEPRRVEGKTLLLINK